MRGIVSLSFFVFVLMLPFLSTAVGHAQESPKSGVGTSVFIRGDCNDDGRITISDSMTLVGYLLRGGAQVNCRNACDTNRDDDVDIADVVYHLDYLFRAGPGSPVDDRPVAIEDETSFVTHAAAGSVGELPRVPEDIGTRITLEAMTISSATGSPRILDWTDAIDGYELFVCESRELTFELAEAVSSFGFQVFEPATEESLRVTLFEEDFESGLERWVGPSEDPWHPERPSGEHYGVVVVDPIEGDKALTFTRTVGGVDAMTREAQRSRTGAYRLTFDYLGTKLPESVADDHGGFVGYTNGLPGEERIWKAGTPAEHPDVELHLPDLDEWRTVSFDFFYGDDVHLMLEDFGGSGGVPGDAYFDNIRLEAISPCANPDEPLVDSVFEVTLLSGEDVVEVHLFRPADDVRGFFGVWSDELFDRVTVRKIEGGTDVELFGGFVVGGRPRPVECVLQRSDHSVSCRTFNSCQSD